MAEGLLRHHAGETFEVASAGSEETRVHPLAIRVMREIGVDMSAHSSKTLARFLDQKWDFVITVCDRANESCPWFPGGAERLHWSFDDPSAAQGTEAERLAVFRQIRDRIDAQIAAFVKSSPK